MDTGQSVCPQEESDDRRARSRTRRRNCGVSSHSGGRDAVWTTLSRRYGMTVLSILDLTRITQDGGPKRSLDHARDLARHAERWGYGRFWLAEHHNMVGIASAATALAIQHVAAGTQTIRVGAGGIMLPNHPPIVIAEQFGTLEHLFPARIDLGLGRAPGTDQATMLALHRDPRRQDEFPRDVRELQHFLSREAASSPIQAVPATGTLVPIWILGSSLYGAQLAAELGLPFGFASHFAPGMLLPALDAYRSAFKPSEALARPYALIGVNVIAADTEAEALRLATTQQMSFADLLRGTRGLSRPPIADIETYWSPAEKMKAERFFERAVFGTRETVAVRLAKLVAETGADELMILSDIFDHQARLRSFELISKAGLTAHTSASPSTANASSPAPNEPHSPRPGSGGPLPFSTEGTAPDAEHHQ